MPVPPACVAVVPMVWFDPVVHWKLHGETQFTPSTVSDSPVGEVVIVCSPEPPDPEPTTTVIRISRLQALDCPARVNVYVPAVAFPCADIVNVAVPEVVIEEGLRLTFHPAGWLVTANDTGPLNPFCALIVTMDVTVPPDGGSAGLLAGAMEEPGDVGDQDLH